MVADEVDEEVSGGVLLRSGAPVVVDVDIVVTRVEEVDGDPLGEE